MTTPIIVRTIDKLSEYNKLVDGPLEKIKELLRENLASGEDKIVDKVIEGDEEIGETKSVVWVMPGPDNIEHSGMRNLAHNVTFYIVYLSSEVQTKDTTRRLRNIAGHGYDVIMTDITLGGLVEKIIPKQSHPGFMKFGETIFVGVLQTWVAVVREGFLI
jgi:hypothetical protein